MIPVIENITAFLGLRERAQSITSRNLITGERLTNEDRVELVWEVLIGVLLKQASKAHLSLAVVSPLQLEAAWIANYVWVTTQRYGEALGWVQTLDAVALEKGGKTVLEWWNSFLPSRRATRLKILHVEVDLGPSASSGF